MIRQIQVNGEAKPADFSILTFIQLAKAYHTDITAVGEIFGRLNDTESQMRFVAEVGALAFTEGARREGRAERYTSYDLLDMMTLDLTVMNSIIEAFIESLHGSAVFQAPQATAAKSKEARKRK